MHKEFITQNRLLLISDGEDEMVLASMTRTPFEIASAWDANRLHTADEVPAVTLNSPQITREFGEEWTWDDLLPEFARRLAHIHLWTRGTVEGQLRGYLGAKSME